MQHDRRRHARTAALIATTAVIGSLAAPVRATSVLPMTVDQLADRAGQVIDGVVVSVTSHWSPDNTTIRSTVRFQNVTYLKGAFADATDAFELQVPGGIVGRTELRVAGAPAFTPGQRWLLFLHPTCNVHPVVGIHRGAFRLEPSPTGQPIVENAAGAILTGIDQRGFPVFAGNAPRRRKSIVPARTTGLIKQVTPVDTPTAAAPMNYDSFIERITPILSRSRSYSLTHPAGQWIRQSFSPTPLLLREPSIAHRKHPTQRGLYRTSNVPRVHDHAPR